MLGLVIYGLCCSLFSHSCFCSHSFTINDTSFKNDLNESPIIFSQSASSLCQVTMSPRQQRYIYHLDWMLVRSQIHLQVTRSASVLLLAIHPKHKLRMCADQLAANLYFCGAIKCSSILPSFLRQSESSFGLVLVAWVRGFVCLWSSFPV